MKTFPAYSETEGGIVSDHTESIQNLDFGTYFCDQLSPKNFPRS